MAPSYSLQYYEDIFGGRTPAFWELVEALETQLVSYAGDLARLLPLRDLDSLARLRHSHRPMVEDLGLEVLQELEAQIQQGLDEGAPPERLQALLEQFVQEASTLVSSLSGERLPTGPGPR